MLVLLIVFYYIHTKCASVCTNFFDLYQAVKMMHPILTMCDFLDFGLTWKCPKCVLGGCTITSKTKSTFFEKFSSLRWPLRDRSVQKFSENVVISLLGFRNSALSCENETKIVKITYSELLLVCISGGTVAQNLIFRYLKSVKKWL